MVKFKTCFIASMSRNYLCCMDWKVLIVRDLECLCDLVDFLKLSINIWLRVSIVLMSLPCGNCPTDDGWTEGCPTDGPLFCGYDWYVSVVGKIGEPLKEGEGITSPGV